jgi:hypothetical protein
MNLYIEAELKGGAKSMGRDGTGVEPASPKTAPA